MSFVMLSICYHVNSHLHVSKHQSRLNWLHNNVNPCAFYTYKILCNIDSYEISNKGMKCIHILCGLMQSYKLKEDMHCPYICKSENLEKVWNLKNTI